MSTDPFQLLRSMADHAEAFEGGRAQAQAAVTAIFTAAVKASDKARLATICDAVGAESFNALAGEMKAADVRTIVDGLKGSVRPARTPAAALATLCKIAHGIVDPPPIDLADLDLAGLRDACRTLGDSFEEWLTKQGAKARTALQKMDPNFPKVATVTPPKARPRLSELAKGAEPTQAKPVDPPRTAKLLRKAGLPAPIKSAYDGPMPSSRLLDLDLDGIRRTKAELGTHFMSWIEAQKPADLKAALARIDSKRPNVKKLKGAEYPFLLDLLASGASVFTKDEDNPPIGDGAFSMQKV